MKYWVKTPRFVPYVFSELVWRFSPAKPNIYLTFDDGPSSLVTEDILSILEEESIKATFFCVGKNVIKNPDLYKKILTRGHSIGNHSMTHPNGWKANSSFYQNDINQATELINSNLFRPPFGRFNIYSLLQILKKYKLVMWDVLSGDFDEKTEEKAVINNVIKNFIDKYTNYKQSGFEKALIEWSEDIEYLKMLYRKQFKE